MIIYQLMWLNKIHESNLHNCEIWRFQSQDKQSLSLTVLCQLLLKNLAWSQCQTTFLLDFRFNGDFDIPNS